MANTAYISAGLPVAKNSGQSPSSGVNTAFISAGLPAAPIFSSTLTSSIGSITSYSTSTVTNLYNQIGGKGIRRRSYSQRPNDFTIDNTHTLARGLVFAGFAPGGMVGSTRYHDSSLYGNHGTLTNMDPATDWVFDPTLGRFRLECDATDDYVSLPKFTGAWSTFSLSIWVLKTTLSTSGFVFGKATPTSTTYDWGLYQSSSTQKFAFFTDTSAGTANNIEATASANGWRHVCGTYDGAKMRLYVDAIQVDEDNQTGTLDIKVECLTGLSIRWSSVYPGFTFADPLAYNRGLSLAEIQQLADPSNTLLSGLIRPPKRTVFKSAVSNFPTTQYTRLSLCALPTRPYKGFIAKTQYTPPIIVLTRHFTPLQLFQNTI